MELTDRERRILPGWTESLIEDLRYLSSVEQHREWWTNLEAGSPQTVFPELVNSFSSDRQPENWTWIAQACGLDPTTAEEVKSLAVELLDYLENCPTLPGNPDYEDELAILEDPKWHALCERAARLHTEIVEFRKTLGEVWDERS